MARPTTVPPPGDAEYDGTGSHHSGFIGFPPDVAALFGLLTEPDELTFTAPGEYPDTVADPKTRWAGLARSSSRSSG
jgi:hypothetical protein